VARSSPGQDPQLGITPLEGRDVEAMQRVRHKEAGGVAKRLDLAHRLFAQRHGIEEEEPSVGRARDAHPARHVPPRKNAFHGPEVCLELLDGAVAEDRPGALGRGDELSQIAVQRV